MHRLYKYINQSNFFVVYGFVCVNSVVMVALKTLKNIFTILGSDKN